MESVAGPPRGAGRPRYSRGPNPSRQVSPLSDTPRRILLIRPSALGDVFRSVPLVASINRRFPGVPLDWVVQTEFIDAVRAHPGVSGVIPFPRHELDGFWRPLDGWRRTSLFLRSLRNGYDLAIDAQGLARSGAMAIFSGAKERIGFADAREFGWVGSNRRIRVDRDLSAVDRMLALLEGAGIPPVPDLALHVPGDVESDWSVWRTKHLGSSGHAAISPTSRWISKQWPIERWVRVGERLLESGRVGTILMLGSSSEAEMIGRAIGEREGFRSLAGEGPLAWSMAGVRDASILLGNDSAMLHAAAGFGVPLVGLFGPTDPAVCGPYGRLEDTIRAPDVGDGVHYRDRNLGDRLMRRIEVEEVIDLAFDRIAANEESQGS